MNQIEPFIQKPFIKVLTGIRRSGKSVILCLVKEKLKERGAQEDHIVYINFESFEWIDINDAKSLYTYIRSQIRIRIFITYFSMRYRR